MRTLIFAFAAFVCFVTTARAEEKVPGAAFIWGVTDVSCGRWLSNSETRNAGEWMIAGMWSGLNLNNAKPGTFKGYVGWTSDKSGIIGEVELICRAEPSIPLYQAILRVYRRLEAERR